MEEKDGIGAGTDVEENDSESHILDEGQGHLRGDDPVVEEWMQSSELEEEEGVIVSSATEDEGPARKRRKAESHKQDSAMQKNRTNADLLAAPCDLDDWAFDIARTCARQPELKAASQEKVQQKRKVRLYTDWSGAAGGEQAFLDVITAIKKEFGIDLENFKFAAVRATDKNNKCKFLLSSCAES